MGYPNWRYKPDAVIETHLVQLTPDEKFVEVIATAVSGQVKPGMYVCVPLNELTDMSARITQVTPTLSNQLRIILDGEGSPDLLVGLNFQDEILGVVNAQQD